MILQSSTAWLNDNIIHAAQTLLKKQSRGTIGGWRSTQCSKRVEKFPVVPPNSPFIQILHVNNNHWITVSNIIDVTKKTHKIDAVRIYDSLYLQISLGTKEDICSFLRPPKKTLMFDVMNIKAQPNSNDCGIFAIACATEIVHGFDPVACNFNCSAMRQHLLNSLTQQYIDRFPSKPRRVAFGRCVRRSYRESIFCTCRMPNNPNCAMIQCDQCKDWFHKDCENLSTEDMEHYKSVKWMCQKCKQFLYSFHE